MHGSFSEGVGSISSHTYEAADVGADVIWWSDHDWRIASYRHVSAFGFEAWEVPVASGEPWKASIPTELFTKSIVLEDAEEIEEPVAEITERRVREGSRSLRLSGTHPGSEFRRHSYSIAEPRGRHLRPLSSRITVRLAIFPESLGPDARAMAGFRLSAHPPNAEVPASVYALHYILDNEIRNPFRDGATYFVPLAYTPGQWNEYSLPVTRDAVEGFPFLFGEDNAMRAITVGIESRRGARAEAYFDGLLIEQQLSGDRSFARQRELIDLVSAATPEVRELQGVEISYVSPHLNEFSVETSLFEYDRNIAESGLLDEEGRVQDLARLRSHIVKRAVEAAHARGGLVSFNHMFGISRASRKARARPTEARTTLERLLSHRLYGADILEVGYRDRGGHPLQDHLWVWDELAKAGLFPVGIGVSDSHGGARQSWRGSPNNFLSWIYADSTDKADLLAGLAAGRVFFGDITLFDGRLDLRTESGYRMGQIVVTQREEDRIVIEIEGLRPGDVVRVVETGREAATYTASGPHFRAVYPTRIPKSGVHLVRVEVYDAAGEAKVFSNPVIYLRERTSGLSPARLVITSPAPS